MCSFTTPETIKSAKKQRRCDWCNQHIEIGQPYERWRGFDARDAYTVRVHPECARASERFASEQGGYCTEWTPGEFNRGCTCASGACECAKGADRG